MNKWIVLGLAATLGAANVVMRAVAVNPPVELQPASPGTSQTGHLNISGTATVGLLKSEGTVFGKSTAPTGFAYGGFFTAASDQGRGFYGYASSPTGLTYGGFFQNASTSGRAVYGLATGTTGSNYGGYFQSAGTTGRGVLGVATATSGANCGVYGKSLSSEGFGVFAEGNLGASGNIFGNGSWITNLSASALTSGTISTARLPRPFELTDSLPYMLRVNNSRYNGIGVMAICTNASPDIALYGQSSGAGGTGAYASGGSRGVIAFASGTPAIAVEGRASATTGLAFGGSFESRSSSGRAVYGYASDGTGINYGVYGETNSSGGWGVWSMGRSGASGTKSFRIDHPADPENRYLLHYSHEGPEPENVYNGNIVTDSRGYATVILPDYYSEINRDPRYSLTVIDGGDDFILAKVCKEIQGNQFRIRTSQPNVKVSWRVDAIRNDRWVRANGAPVEQEKPVGEKGFYQHPELYGLGPERGMTRAVEADLAGARKALPEAGRK